MQGAVKVLRKRTDFYPVIIQCENQHAELSSLASARRNVFFTVVTHIRQRFLTNQLARKCLREAIAKVRAKRPFEISAIVLLPDHLHTIWNLPPGDADYSVRWRRIKEEFSREYLEAGGREATLTPSRKRRSERGIWQRRFWEHTIVEEHDFERHFDYIHYNPVKHGYVKSPKDWPWSSFHRWIDNKVYSPEWGALFHGPLDFDDINETAIELRNDKVDC